jgi:uncharacterized protein YpmS
VVLGPWAVILSCPILFLLSITLALDHGLLISILSYIEMDITIKVKERNSKMYSKTFVGDKEQILPQMQEYIEDNKHHYIDIFFSTEEESKAFTYDELFNPK